MFDPNNVVFNPEAWEQQQVFEQQIEDEGSDENNEGQFEGSDHSNVSSSLFEVMVQAQQQAQHEAVRDTGLFPQTLTDDELDLTSPSGEAEEMVAAIQAEQALLEVAEEGEEKEDLPFQGSKFQNITFLTPSSFMRIVSDFCSSGCSWSRNLHRIFELQRPASHFCSLFLSC